MQGSNPDGPACKYMILFREWTTNLDGRKRNSNFIIIGRSGGAIIGLELATTMPEVIDFLIVYEAPVIEILSKSDAEKWRSFVNNIYRKSQHEASHAAQTEFMESLINVPNSPLPPDLNDRISGNVAFFFDHEFRSFFGYMPNIEIIRKNSINMVTAVGQESNDAYYVQATKVLANKLGCEILEFPGHHDLSLWMPKEFANAIQNTLERYRYQQGHKT